MSDKIKPGYTRVSTILSQWDRFGQINQSVLELKRQLGTNVHKAIKEYLECGFFPTDEKCKGYFLSFINWYKETDIDIVESEQRYYDDQLMITGCIDALIRFPNSSELILTDFKTSATEEGKMWPLQGQMYHNLVTVNGKKISDRFIFLMLRKDGELPKVVEYKVSKIYCEICRAALLTYRYLNV